MLARIDVDVGKVPLDSLVGADCPSCRRGRLQVTPGSYIFSDPTESTGPGLACDYCKKAFTIKRVDITVKYE